MPDSKQHPTHVRLGNNLLRIAEDVVYVGSAALLAIAALIVLARSGLMLVDRAFDDDLDGMLDVLDSLLLVFIFVELLYAVRITLKERQIVAEPFLITGVLVAIKEIIVLSVKAAGDYIDQGPQFARAMVEIGLLTGVVVLLAGATILLRRKEQELPENTTTPTPDDD